MRWILKGKWESSLGQRVGAYLQWLTAHGLWMGPPGPEVGERSQLSTFNFQQTVVLI